MSAARVDLEELCGRMSRFHHEVRGSIRSDRDLAASKRLLRQAEESLASWFRDRGVELVGLHDYERD